MRPRCSRGNNRASDSLRSDASWASNDTQTRSVTAQQHQPPSLVRSRAAVCEAITNQVTSARPGTGNTRSLESVAAVTQVGTVARFEHARPSRTSWLRLRVPRSAKAKLGLEKLSLKLLDEPNRERMTPSWALACCQLLLNRPKCSDNF